MKALALSALFAHLVAQSGTSFEAQLSHALALDAANKGEEANALLSALSDDAASRQALGLELVEAWWRLSHRERAINTLSKWQREAPRNPDPLIMGRARALTGSPFDAEVFWRSLSSAATPTPPHCRLLKLAQSLDAVGQREVAQGLLERSWDDPRCTEREAQRALWEAPRGAPPLSATSARPRARGPLRFVLGPGLESRVVGIMPEQPGELPEGVGLIDLSIPEEVIEARYGPLDAEASSCDEAPLCLSLHHPSLARPGDRLVGGFALRQGGRGGYEAEALVDGVSARIKALGAWDPWREVRQAPRPAPKAEARSAQDPSPSKAQRAPTGGGTPWVALGLFAMVALVLVALARRRAGDGDAP